MAEAARLLIVELNRPPAPPASAAGPASDPIPGLMRDADDDMDEIVADAYRRRSQGTFDAIALEEILPIRPGRRGAGRADRRRA